MVLVESRQYEPGSREEGVRGGDMRLKGVESWGTRESTVPPPVPAAQGRLPDIGSHTWRVYDTYIPHPPLPRQPIFMLDAFLPL